MQTVIAMMSGQLQAILWAQRGALAVAVVAALLAVAAYCLFGRDGPLEAVDMDEVPDGLSALEVGTAIDGIVSGEDLGAQLFDWAARGHVHLRLEGAEWTLIRGEPPREEGYERTAWNQLFDGGSREITSPQYHQDDILLAIHTLQEGAESVFAEGPRRLTDARSAHVALAVWVMGAVCLLTAAVFGGWQRGLSGYAIAFLTIGAMVPAVVSAWLSGWLQRFYQVRTRRKNVLVLVVILLCDGIMGFLDVQLVSGGPMYLAWQVAPLVAAGIFAGLLSPFVGRRSPYGRRLFCQLMGFRDALADPERFPGRVEGESKEHYLVRMLPYAQVLGVGDALVAQFGAFTMTCPDWLEWREEEPFSAVALQHCLIQIRDRLLSPGEGE